MRVLIADDDPLCRCALETKLGRWGYETIVVPDGNKAWEVLQREDAPMLAILDWGMPGLSGVEICQKVRQENAGGYTYLILLTGRDRTEDVVEGMEAGADDYVTKPVRSGELKARLHAATRILELHEQVIRESLAREEAQKQHLAELAQVRKLEAVGQLAAGIAHEINTPMQYAGDNTRFLAEAFADISTVLAAYSGLFQESRRGPVGRETIANVESALNEADVPYLREEVPRAIEQSLEGIERVTKIVRAMRDFSHPGVEEKSSIDINNAIESTITICRNEWKYVAEMRTDLAQDLPAVLCLAGEVNQVILNLIINAAQAIADVVGDGSGGKGTIAVGTRRDGGIVEICVSDTGGGIPEDVRPRIFDPFFTTKDVGRGTGQGLAIARSVIVDKHDGTIDFETEMRKGTTFTIRLPIDATSVRRPDAAAKETANV